MSMKRSMCTKLHRILSGVMMVTLLCGVMLLPIPGMGMRQEVAYAALTGFDGGDGTAQNPYQISSVNQFQYVQLGAEGANIYYVLTRDIMTASSQARPLLDGDFYGVFDGNGHHLSMKQMFCTRLISPGVIRNLEFDSYITGTMEQKSYCFAVSNSYLIAGIAGYSNSLIDNCVATSCYIHMTSPAYTYEFVAGFVGLSEYGTLTNCGMNNADLDITSSTKELFAGGFIAQTRGSTLNNCYVIGKIRCNGASQKYYVGSMVAHFLYNREVRLTNCYAYNTAAGSEFSGKEACVCAVARLEGNPVYSFSNCYYRSLRHPDGEWALATGGTPAGLTRIQQDPNPLYTANNTSYRKWQSGTSFARYAENTAYGRNTITLDARDGHVESTTLTKVIGETVTIPVPNKRGFTFGGWALKKTDVNPAFLGGETIHANASFTLYALWTPIAEYGQGVDGLELSNMADLLETAEHKMHPEVPGSKDNLADLCIHLTDAKDEITIYRIAEMDYDEESKTYGKPYWVPEMAQWVQDSGSPYVTPELLGAAYASEVKAFLTYVFYDEYSGITKEPYLLPKYIPVDYREQPAEDVMPFVYQSPEEDKEDGDPTILITGLEPGEYIVFAENGNQTFTPFVVNIIPERTGLTGEYFLQDVYEIELKAAMAGVSKYIVKGQPDSGASQSDTDPEDAHMDTAYLGEVKSFRIVVDMPNYKDRITLSSDGTALDYVMTVTDLMDESICVEDITGSLSVWYMDPDDQVAKPVSANPVEYHVYVDEAYKGEKTAFDAESGESSNLTEGYYITRTAPLYTVTEIGRRNSERNPGNEETGFAVEFNMAALKSWAKANGFYHVPQMELRYDGQVTEDIKVASESNTNYVTITYEVTDAGDVYFSQDDVVNLYTYGLKLYKRDGDTNEALAGAQFFLYKRIGAFRDEIWDEDSSALYGAASQENAFVSPENAGDGILLPLPEGFETLKDFEDSPDYYVYSYRDGTTGEMVNAVFLKVSHVGNGGMIVSTGSAYGDFVSGLTEGEYLLEEVVTPEGYNRLDSDMIFDIVRFSQAEVTASGKNSFATFKDITGLENTAGIYEVVVLNYAGFVLPVTGGAGTVLFTICGISIVVVLFLFIFLRKQKQNMTEEELF